MRSHIVGDNTLEAYRTATGSPAWLDLVDGSLADSDILAGQRRRCEGIPKQCIFRSRDVLEVQCLRKRRLNRNGAFFRKCRRQIPRVRTDSAILQKSNELLLQFQTRTIGYSMEAWRHVQESIYRVVVIQLILLVGMGFSSEVGSCVSNPDSMNPNISAFSHFEKYIMKPYFEKYDSLFDSNFEDFIAHDLSLGSCEELPDNLNLVLRLSVLQRYLIGEGSHRRLSSSIRFKIQSEFISELPTHFCEFIIIEKLPSGVFADPFELQHLLQCGVFTDAAVFGDTNLELPSVRSNRSLVEVHIDTGPNILSRHKNGLEVNIELPLHARYPLLEESGGYSRVEFGAPDLFMRCRIEGKSHTQSCLLVLKDNDAESKTPIVWKIPSGIKVHAGVVSVFTFGTAILSTLLIVLTSIYNSDTKLCKMLKKPK